MASSHKLCALLITSDLPLRGFIMTILMWSSLLNCIKISETSTKYTKGGHLSSLGLLTLFTA